MQVLSVISFLAAVVTVRADSFSAEDQAIWIDRHNYFRTTGLPWSAGDMRRIGWSSELATTAASTAAKCSAVSAAGINAFQSTSTNSSSIIDEAIQQWVVETSMTTLKTLAQPGASGVDVGTGTYNSYSQVLWASTTSVGCATASCSGGDVVVCQYSPAGNDGSSPWYVHADTASDCPSGTTASQGLCIVDGDAANNQIAAIPAGKLTYEVYPAYVANMQTVLIEAARAIASGSTGSTTQSTPATTAPTATTAAPTATTAAPTATKAPPSETSSSSSSAGTKTSTKEDTGEKTSSSKETTSSSSSSSDSAATKTSKTTPTSSSSSDSTKQSSKTTSSSTTDSSETKQTDDSAPGTVKASSDTGSTFTNQASTATESPAQQTSSSTNAANTPSTANTESTTASTTTSSGGGATSINNKSGTESGGGISAAGLAGMIVLAIVGIAAFGVVMSYKRNQQRQREIMRDGGIRII
eukprot:jgi/Phyca11/504130/fgenesh2_kg.PHYCAscaffold_6_\